VDAAAPPWRKAVSSDTGSPASTTSTQGRHEAQARRRIVADVKTGQTRRGRQLIRAFYITFEGRHRWHEKRTRAVP